jgi:hypothetical protein
MLQSTIRYFTIERRYYTMFKHSGGRGIGSGTYRDMRVNIDQEGTVPGETGATNLKASSIAMLLLGPILGLAYVVLLPIMGVVTALSLLVRKTLGGVYSLSRNIICFGWRPTEAYLGGKNRKKDDGDKAGGPPTAK